MRAASDSPEGSITGLWHGQYSYPIVHRAPVPFSASLIQSEACLSGTITERAMLGRVQVRILYASVTGQRTGSSVSFLKLYEANSGSYTSVAYQGVLSGDGLEIDGEWIASGWSGRFLMIRAGGVATKVARRVEEQV
jgi:hypothetical protein